MQPLAVDLLLLRSVLTPELRIAPGRALMARVVNADGAGRGTLSIAGAAFEAELPRHVRAGQDLRLVVREVTDNRVVLSLADQAADTSATAPPLAPPATIPLPGGGALAVLEREHRSGSSSGEERDVLSIRYAAPHLGPIDLRFDLRAGTLHVGVNLDAGEPFRRAQAGATELRQALQENVKRDISLKLTARREPFDVYA
ncbi:MAG: hypothetical protein ACJ76X_16280 [Solirubrobacteraceae bacterium]